MMKTEQLGLSAAAFSRIAHRTTTPSDLALLAESTLNRHWYLVALMAEFVRENSAKLPGESAKHFRQTLKWIDRQKKRHPTVAANVMSYPMVGGWICSLMRDIEGLMSQSSGTPERDEFLPGHLAQLGNIAAALALQTGEAYTGLCLVRYSLITLPGLGGLATQPGTPRTVPVTIKGRRVTSKAFAGGDIHLPDDLLEASAGWQPLPQVSTTASGLTLRVVLDPLDPYGRDVREGTVDTPNETSVAQWRAVLSEAWAILTTHHRDEAAGSAP